MLSAILRHIEVIGDRVPDEARYPFTIPAVAKMGRLTFDESVTFFVGENGSGKSTFVEAIAIKAGFNPEGGSKNFSSSHRPSESDLASALRLARGTRRERSGFFLRAETMFNVSTEAEAYRSYGWATLHEMSHGEAFLWVAMVAMNRFRDGGLYILDEPEAALSPQRQLAFMARMHQLVLGGSQFIIATHSPILLAYPKATLYQLDVDGISMVDFTDTDHFAITRSVLQNPSEFMARLLTDVEEDA